MASRKVLVSVSLLASSNPNFVAAARIAKAAGADLLHVDVMDGDFVPRVAYTAGAVRKLKAARLPIEVHLMVNNPAKLVSRFAKAGAKRICFHAEAQQAGLLKTIAAVRKAGCKAGVAINPATPVAALPDAVLRNADFIMVMSVAPGWSGQPFNAATPSRLRQLQARLRKLKLNTQVEVDGGVTDLTAPACVAAGATVLGVGSAFYRSTTPRKLVKFLKAL